MTHALYVGAAYGLSALAICGLIAWILRDQTMRRRELAELESKGVRRRSGAGGNPQ